MLEMLTMYYFCFYLMNIIDLGYIVRMLALRELGEDSHP